MCGIIGYIGKNKTIDILLEGLKNLEYRGYDSAGIAIKKENDLQIIKSVGRIKELEEKIKNTTLISGDMGIAHTRWATHGSVNVINAHPHKVGKITLVHNGIIENAQVLRKKLIAEGVVFKSETDTEVIASLIDKLYDGDILEALNKAIKELKGSYALAIMVDNLDKLYAIRKDSPLIIGVGEKEYYIASDIAAIINYTSKYLLLEEGEIAELSKNGIEITDEGFVVDKEILEADIAKEEKDKNGYPHYMLKEIMEEPMVLERTMQPYLDDLSLLPNLEEYLDIHIVACGSAMYAGMIGKALFEEYANVRVECECASEYRYKRNIYNNKTLVILISQSGETADTIAAMRKAKEENIPTLAIVNVKSSTIAREADRHIFIEAGPEIAVATTKAYLLQVAIMALLALKTAANKNLIDSLEYLQEAKNLPKELTKVLAQSDLYKKIAQDIYKCEDAFFIGRKLDYAMSLEGSLKLKEIAYVHSEAYQAGELKHGTISLIENEMPVFALITEDDIKDKTISNVIEVKSRGAKVILITNDEKLESEYKVVVKKCSPFFQAILIIPTLQLIAYYVALLRNCDIDKPKNLAKSVTVE